MRVSEKRLNNTIYLMDRVRIIYMKKHRMNIEKFIRLSDKTGLLHFISKFPSEFDGLPDEEMLRIAEEYIHEKI